ncbi:MAG: YcaO-like family protein [Chloroflexota bacterium]
MNVTATYRWGTHRVVPPEETLKRVAPHLSTCGITRYTSVTHLDSLGIPVYCSIRPGGYVLQVSNGKGLTDAEAKASAVMEALELFHAENPLPNRLWRTCLEELQAQEQNLLLPEELDGFRGGYLCDRFRCDWIEGKDLHSGKKVWAPASAVYFSCRPTLHVTSTNGLASGNHIAEATLHALYELIERDAMSRLSVDGKLKILARAQIIDTSTVDTPELRGIIDRVEAQDTKVVLLWLQSCVPLHTFWALFLNKHSHVAGTTLNVGWGTHLDKRIAAARALTEAAQSRLTFIHGAREDALIKPVYNATDVQNSPAYRFFDRLKANVGWASLDERETLPVTDDLEECLEKLVVGLVRAGHDRLALFDLSRPHIGVPVVKVLAPSLQFNRKLF